MPEGITVTFAGSGDAFGSGGRLQACIHLPPAGQQDAVLLDYGATSLAALKRQGLDPGEIGVVVVSHLHSTISVGFHSSSWTGSSTVGPGRSRWQARQVSQS